MINVEKENLKKVDEGENVADTAEQPVSKIEAKKVAEQLEQVPQVIDRVSGDIGALQKIALKIGKPLRVLAFAFSMLLAKEAMADDVKQDKSSFVEMDPEVKAVKKQLEFAVGRTLPMQYEGENQKIKDYASKHNEALRAIEKLSKNLNLLNYLNNLRNNAMEIYELDADGNPSGGMSWKVKDAIEKLRSIQGDVYFDIFNASKNATTWGAEIDHELAKGAGKVDELVRIIKSLERLHSERDTSEVQVAETDK